MNDFYLRKNGKAIIFDEEGVETSREYEDGMKTILESENRVEKIEKNIVANKKQNRELAIKTLEYMFEKDEVCDEFDECTLHKLDDYYNEDEIAYYRDLLKRLKENK